MLTLARMPLQAAVGNQRNAARMPAPSPVTINVFSWFSLGLTPPMRSEQRPRKQRWGAGDSHPVAGATLELYDSNLARVAEFDTRNPDRSINRLGQRPVHLTFLDDGNYILLLVPPASHELRPRSNPAGLATGDARYSEVGRPVGPWDRFHGDPPGHRRFRQLEITLTMEGGVLTGAILSAHMWFTLPNGSDVSHGAVLLDGGDLWVDWRPDFVQIRNSKLKTVTTARGRQLGIAHFIHLHHTDAATPGSTLDEFIHPETGKDKGVQYLVDTNGFLIKLCHEDVRAGHAGPSHWYDLDSCKSGNTIPSFNNISVGIEQVHAKGATTFSSDQLAATNWLLTNLRGHLGTSEFNVLGDGETAINHETDSAKKSLGRKVDCPGLAYEWTVIEDAGNSTRPRAGATVPHALYDNFFLSSPAGELSNASPAAIAGLQATLASLGYFVELGGGYDNATERAVEAFQGRYFSGAARAGELATVRVPIRGKPNAWRPVANLACVTRMHEVRDARGTTTY